MLSLPIPAVLAEKKHTHTIQKPDQQVESMGTDSQCQIKLAKKNCFLEAPLLESKTPLLNAKFWRP